MKIFLEGFLSFCIYSLFCVSFFVTRTTWLPKYFKCYMYSCVNIQQTFTDLREIFLVDGGEGGVQGAVGRGQRLDEGQEP